MFNGSGYMTKGFQEEIPDKIKMVLSGLIEELRLKDDAEVDNLQVFELSNISNGILVRHIQETPANEKLIILQGFVGVQLEKKVYALDDQDHYTFFLEGEN